MLQYIFFIYNSTIKESNEESNGENHFSLCQNYKGNFWERDFTEKIYNSQDFGQDVTHGNKRSRNNTCMSSYICKKPKLMLNESESHEPLDLTNKALDLTRKSEHFSQNDTFVETRAENKTCSMPCHSEKNFENMSNEFESLRPCDLPNRVIDLTQESEPFSQNDTFVMTRAENNTHMSFQICKNFENMSNEFESLRPCELSNRVIDLTQESEPFSQNDTFVMTRAENKTCSMPCHSEKNSENMSNEFESHIMFKFFSTVKDLTQESEHFCQNDMLENKNEKSLSEKTISILQKLLERIYKHSDAKDKKDSEKTFDPSMIKDPLDVLADEILKFQNEFLGNNQNLIIYNADAIQNLQKLQESFKTLNLMMKFSALNFYIKQEFKYEKQFIINFLQTHINYKQKKKYKTSRSNLNEWKNDTNSILSSEELGLEGLISKSILHKDMKDYLLNYIEFIKISLKHISKLMPNYYLQPDNIIKLLYWFMRFINEKNIFDNLFDLKSLQRDVYDTGISFLLSNKKFNTLNSCLNWYLKDKEIYAKTCVKYILVGNQ